MRTKSVAASALLASTTAFTALAVALAGNASAAQSGELAGSCGRHGTVITLDLSGYDYAGPNTANITLDGSRPSRVSFGTDYHWSSGSLDNTVDNTARVVVRSQGGRSFSDTVTVAACR